MIMRIVFMSVLGLLIAACASSEAPQSIEERLAERGYLIGPDDQRIPRYRISSWNDIDDRYLTVRSGVNDHYLIELNAPCFGLESAFTVGFATPTSRLDRFGSVLVTDIGGRRERCRILNIYLLEPVE